MGPKKIQSPQKMEWITFSYKMHVSFNGEYGSNQRDFRALFHWVWIWVNRLDEERWSIIKQWGATTNQKIWTPIFILWQTLYLLWITELRIPTREGCLILRTRYGTVWIVRTHVALWLSSGQRKNNFDPYLIPLHYNPNVFVNQVEVNHFTSEGPRKFLWWAATEKENFS